MTIGGVPPLLNKPLFSLIRGWHYRGNSGQPLKTMVTRLTVFSFSEPGTGHWRHTAGDLLRLRTLAVLSTQVGGTDGGKGGKHGKHGPLDGDWMGNFAKIQLFRWVKLVKYYIFFVYPDGSFLGGFNVGDHDDELYLTDMITTSSG
jgi:hypothetical protein